MKGKSFTMYFAKLFCNKDTLGDSFPPKFLTQNVIRLGFSEWETNVNL